MEFMTDMDDELCEVNVAGELTIYQVNEFKKELERVIERASVINMNMANVSEIDTSCFQLLMQAQIACHDNDKQLNFVSISPAIREVMELFGLENYLNEPETSTSSW